MKTQTPVLKVGTVAQHSEYGKIKIKKIHRTFVEISLVKKNPIRVTFEDCEKLFGESV